MVIQPRSERIGLPIPFGWYCVGYADELAPGDLRGVRYFGEDLVLYRTQEGRAHLVTAFCPHLGANLAHGGRVLDKGLRCPFHGWVFGDAGEAVEIPYAEKIPALARKADCLHHLPLEERGEFLFAWYHPSGDPPSFELAHFAELESGEWTACRRKQWRIATHVQESGENAVDTAHFRAVHNTGELLTQGEVTFEGVRRESLIQVAHQRVDSDGPIGEKDTEAVAGQIHSVNIGPGVAWNRNYGIDLLMIGLPTPIDPDLMEFRFAISVPRADAEKNAEITELVLAGAFEQIEQDIPIWEHKRYEPRPLLCDGDGPIAKYRKWFRHFYVTEDPS